MNIMGLNNERKDKIKELFGTLWNSLTLQATGIGAFVLWHRDREFYLDANTAALIGTNESMVTYEELVGLCEEAELGGDTLSPVKVILLDTQEQDVTAGVVMQRHTDEMNDTPELEILVSEARLSEEIAAAGKNAFLMLMQIEHTETGRDEASFIRSALFAVRNEAKEGSVLSAHSRQQYWLLTPGGVEDAAAYARKIQEAVRGCSILDEFGVLISDAHSMTISGGFVSFEGERREPMVKLMHYASFALYEATSSHIGELRSFSEEQYQLHKSDYRKVQNFMYLLENNLFHYHFQPIVSAKDGAIVAYEALMRTEKSIGLNPLQILEMAQKYDRLYEIEYYTMFNVLDQLSRNHSFFRKRKLFINAIPSSFLSEEDWDRFASNYGELLEKTVIELTEQTDCPDEQLSFVMKRLRKHNMQMAIDDYGTGYSNTSRLIKHTPDYIKIDHSLISHIDTNVRLQSIVSGLVEMMHSNGFIVLGEGVETAAELRTLIGMNVDLFQGFYISRPKPIFINEIGENIQSEIIRYNLEMKENINKIYYTETDTELTMDELVREKYTGIYISGGKLFLSGSTEAPAVIMPITVKDGTECEIELKDTCIEALPDSPVIALGIGAAVKLECKGINRFIKGGILVPAGASLDLTVGGKLSLLPEAASCYGIGNEIDLTHGRINIVLGGELTISTNGDNCVGIGGGRTDSGPISITGGKLAVSVSGASSLGIGASDDTEVIVKDCDLSINSASATFIGIGSAHGILTCGLGGSSVSISSGGNKMYGIGTLGGTKAVLTVSDCVLSTSMRGRSVVHIGTYGAVTECNISSSKVTLYGEGGFISGIGDASGGGDVSLKDTQLDITFLTGNGFAMGSADGKLTFEGGSKSIKINE